MPSQKAVHLGSLCCEQKVVGKAYDRVVFLAHSPNIITLIHQNGLKADLLLSGHTHGGQIRLFGKPLGGGAYKHFHVGQKVEEAVGIFSISRGLGTAKLPVRLFCFPEITVYQMNHHQTN